MAPLAPRPAIVFTSIGKKVITTTTAALDGQSKPNHITRIGAMPITGRADTKLPSGTRPRCRNGLRSMAMAARKAEPQPRAEPLKPPSRGGLGRRPPRTEHPTGGKGGVQKWYYQGWRDN